MSHYCSCAGAYCKPGRKNECCTYRGGVMTERYDPYLDPDADDCPNGCGRLTDDPYGGPCSRCWDALRAAQREESTR